MSNQNPNSQPPTPQPTPAAPAELPQSSEVHVARVQHAASQIGELAVPDRVFPADHFEPDTRGQFVIGRPGGSHTTFRI